MWAKQNLPLDPARTHWLGALQEDQYRAVLAVSDVHFYLTVPFVLSWSLLEAMAAGCSLVCSSTPPVLEVLTHGSSALLVDFFSVDEQVGAIQHLFDDRQLAKRLSEAAQSASARYSHAAGLSGWLSLLTA